jgi:hypothetical protein
MFKSLFVLAVLLSSVCAAAAPKAAAKTQPETASSIEPGTESSADFKGNSEPSEFSIGAMPGAGILDNHVGFAILGTASKKIVHRGFVPDINDSVSIEVEMGPLFVSGSAAFQYSGHLRWDFEKDTWWTLYALGGLGGDITGASLGDRFELYPRFAMGAMWKIGQNFALRGELSHEFIGIGILFPM